MKFIAKTKTGVKIMVEQKAGAVLAKAGLIDPIPHTLRDGLDDCIPALDVIEMTAGRKLTLAIQMAARAATMPAGAWPETQQAWQDVFDNLPAGMDLATVVGLAAMKSKPNADERRANRGESRE